MCAFVCVAAKKLSGSNWFRKLFQVQDQVWIVDHMHTSTARDRIENATRKSHCMIC